MLYRDDLSSSFMLENRRIVAQIYQVLSLVSLYRTA